MVGSPLDQKCITNDSICSEVVEKQLEGPLLTPMSPIGRYPVLSSKKDAQILKVNSSHALNTQVLSGKETESIRKLRIRAETRNRSSFSSHTISSSRKIRTKKQKVQVQQIQPRLRKDSVSESIMTSQVQDTPVPSIPPSPVHKNISAPSPVLKEMAPIQTFIHLSKPTVTHTKSSVAQKASSKPQLSHQRTQNKAPVHQSKIRKSPISHPPQTRIRSQNSVSQSEPSKQYVSRRSGTQRTSVPPWALAGKTRLPTSIRQPTSSTSTKEPSRIRERCLGHEEPIHHIVWEGSDANFHSSEITCCPICENDLSYMPDEYADAYAYAHADEYYDAVEPSVLPSVAILSCGHSFHAVCLDGITPEENSSDPPCFFCLSCMLEPQSVC